MSAYPAQSWYFARPQVIKITLTEGELLTPEKVRGMIHPKTDLLILKSGWHRFRGSVRYSRKNPGIHESFACFLRTEHPSIRAIGFDWISASSFLKREEGWAAHRAFLGARALGKPILMLEDMDLRKTNSKLKQVWVAPLRVRGIDSAPCTVMGIFR